MKIRAQLNAAEFAELRRMTRSWMHWPRLIMRNHVSLLLGIGLLCSTAAALVYRGDDVSWLALAAIWLVIGAIAAWGFRNHRKSRAAELARFNAKLPEFALIGSDGIRFEPSAAGNVNLHWGSFRSWREGRLLFLLVSKNAAVYPLPKSDLTSHETEILRGTMASALVNNRRPGDRP